MIAYVPGRSSMDGDDTRGLKRRGGTSLVLAREGEAMGARDGTEARGSITGSVDGRARHVRTRMRAGLERRAGRAPFFIAPRFLDVSASFLPAGNPSCFPRRTSRETDEVPDLEAYTLDALRRRWNRGLRW